MILFLYGPDTFRSKRKLAEIIEKYRSKYRSGLNFTKIEISEENLNELKDKIETIPMFKEKKMIIIKNLFSSPKNLQEEIREYLVKKDLFKNKDIILIFFEEGEIKTKGTLFKSLLKNSFKKQEFRELPPAGVKNFIKKEVGNLGGKIHPKALEKLVFYYQNDLWQIVNEIKKLIAFVKGEVIQVKDVEKICEAQIYPNIFGAIEAISRKNKKDALRLISDLFKKRENEMKILAMINYQFRNLIKIKSLLLQGKSFYQIKRVSGLHPFVIKKTLPIARNFSMEELKKVYKRLLDLDFKIKTGKIEPRIGIEMFVMEL